MKTQTTKIIVTTILLGLVCFGLLPKAEAVVPAPDGGYPGFNTAEGQNALLRLTTGTGNTAVGWLSLRSNTEGNFNTAIGAGALVANVSEVNTATGAGALLSTTTGGNNTANGGLALFANTTGQSNTATGSGALLSNTTADGNTGTGFHALFSHQTGNFNTAFGANSLLNDTSGDSNTAVGEGALLNNTSGDGNTAIGSTAGASQTTGSSNVYIGANMFGVAGESNACYIASIFGQTSADGTQIFINSNNKLGTMTSSKRFKETIKPMDKASESLLSLKPVIFRYRKEIDPAGKSQFGLLAEDVEKVNPDLVVCDKEGKPYTVRYDQVNAMLLNEFLKEHRKVQELQATIAKQQKDFQATASHQQKQIEALTMGLQKVSDQIEVSKSAAKVARNN
jgi:hypothetical protein